jgi:hypothetical protein
MSHAHLCIRSHFQNICNNINILILLTHQNNRDLGRLFSNVFKHGNTVLNQSNTFIS